jgi:hypothetical protein
MRAAIDENARHLTVTIPLEEEPHPSQSGKTLVIARTKNFQETGLVVAGRKVKILLSAVLADAVAGLIVIAPILN